MRIWLHFNQHRVRTTFAAFREDWEVLWLSVWALSDLLLSLPMLTKAKPNHSLSQVWLCPSTDPWPHSLARRYFRISPNSQIPELNWIEWVNISVGISCILLLIGYISLYLPRNLSLLCRAKNISKSHSIFHHAGDRKLFSMQVSSCCISHVKWEFLTAIPSAKEGPGFTAAESYLKQWQRKSLDLFSNHLKETHDQI